MMFLSAVDLILDILIPSTDKGVGIQFVVVSGFIGLALWRFWRKPEIRLLTIGSGLVLLGLMGFRALH
jgi:hypothetical protein